MKEKNPEGHEKMAKIPRAGGESMARCREDARRGDSDAQYRLGLLGYLSSFDFPRQREGDPDWWHNYHEWEHPQTLFSVCTPPSFGAPKYDVSDAVTWLQKAAEQGHADANFLLAGMYRWGHGVPEDEAMSRAFYRKAAELGHCEAQYELGWMYLWGDYGGSDDAVLEADAWYRKAAEQGHEYAQFELASMYSDSLKEAPDGHFNATALYQKAAENGAEPAQYELALRYLHGTGVQQSDTDAVFWMRKAAEADYPDAQFELGMMCLNGRGVSKDEAEAAVWFRKAAEARVPATDGQRMLGWMYMEGRGGLPKDYAEAEKWLQRAADDWDPDAKALLGKLLRRGVE